MKAWQITSFGINQLALNDLAEPKPKAGEVLVRVHAVSLNYRDLLMVRGQYNPKMALPRIPCSDGAGEVVAVGEGVTKVTSGDRVAGIFMQHWQAGVPSNDTTKGALGGDVDGMLAEYVVLPETGVVRFPDHLSHAQAATLPCAGVTAWNALTKPAPVKAGDVVVTQGTGGVSIFALQFARLMGATVLGTSSSDEKLERAKKLGLAAGVNYRQNSRWSQWVMDQTGKRGADLVVEVGGLGTLGESLQAVRIGGTVAQIGILSQGEQALPIPVMLHRQIRLQGIYVGSREDFEAMNRAITATKMVPVVDKTFAFREAREAFFAMEQGSHFGKIVLEIVT